MCKRMCTGYYLIREKKDDFIKQIRYSKELIQWLVKKSSISSIWGEGLVIIKLTSLKST